ncbi:OsmC family protein [Thermus oshimai]|uniref:Peroxiredoxin, OsmC subfamily n=1 Tax=Thermus oshimai JL-2 TaxID=751945 RepID=K7QTV8_THEOS|nr:OsmC family protein [Thermus oshimai]AFV75481.1 peroxiredoxin, OsmC subfamily [Thermus oshimai JL-2]
MPVRKASAVWEGGLRTGKGSMRLESQAFEGPYSFPSRFEEGAGTNPEELIAAAHAGCFSMALSGALERAGYPPKRVATQAHVHLEMVEGRPTITRIDLVTEAEVPGIAPEEFLRIAEEAKAGCPVSRALAGVGEIRLTARLV